MIKSKITTDSDYNGLPLLPYNGPNRGFYEPILDKISERLNASLVKTSKCLLVRLVVKFPADLNADNDNGCFQYLMEEYRRSLGNKLLHYIWVREQHDSHNHHYHLILLLNGNRIQYFKSPSKAVHLWCKALNRPYTAGLVHICPGALFDDIPMNHGIMIHRNNPGMQQDVFKLCSYLAKVNTKGNTPKNVREYGTSLLKNNI